MTHMLEIPNYKEKGLDKEHITKKGPYNITKYITIHNKKNQKKPKKHSSPILMLKEIKKQVI